jgi:hypothetical protein
VREKRGKKRKNAMKMQGRESESGYWERRGTVYRRVKGREEGTATLERVGAQKGGKRKSKKEKETSK